MFQPRINLKISLTAPTSTSCLHLPGLLPHRLDIALAVSLPVCIPSSPPLPPPTPLPPPPPPPFPPPTPLPPPPSFPPPPPPPPPPSFPPPPPPPPPPLPPPPLPQSIKTNLANTELQMEPDRTTCMMKVRGTSTLLDVGYPPPMPAPSYLPAWFEVSLCLSVGRHAIKTPNHTPTDPSLCYYRQRRLWRHISTTGNKKRSHFLVCLCGSDTGSYWYW